MTAKTAPRVAVIGSNMMDLVTYVTRMPQWGETLEALDLRDGAWRQGRQPGGGGRQARRRRHDADQVGDDMFADNTIAISPRFGIDTRHVQRVPGRSSGVAPIMVDPSGENSILIVKGANDDLLPADIERAAEDLKTCALILLQLEDPGRNRLCGDRVRQAARHRDAAQSRARGARPRPRADPGRDLPGAQRDASSSSCRACRSTTKSRSRSRPAVSSPRGSRP